MDANNYKNHLIAKAIMTILYTNESGPNKRNENEYGNNQNRMSG